MSGMGKRVRAAGITGVLLAASICSGAQSAWTVKPEWVRAHEAFLASDALRGRGSATHDEEIAAEYVASEFEAYGLEHAPGMGSYVQSAEIVGPQLNGHATLTAGNVSIEEGKGFTLLRSGGGSVGGRLVKLRWKETATNQIEPFSVVAVGDVPEGKNPLGAVAPLARTGVGMMVVPWDKSVAEWYSMVGGKTRLPLLLKTQRAMGSEPTVVALDSMHMAEILRMANGTAVQLQATRLPQAEPRMTYNAIGYLPGTDRNAGTILLTAHLDHLGVGRPVNGDAIFNGANDDAAGTTAVLELAHALAAGPKLRRSVLFVCYGSEEAGGLGSTYFGEHPPVPLKELVANLEFEMIGNQDPKMPKGVLLLTGWERSNLGPTLKEHGALLGPDPYPEQHFFERSDNYSLALRGVVAHTAAGWGTPPTYHQPSDDLAHLDLPFMTTAIQSLVEPVRWLANSEFVPRWNAGGQPKR